MIIDKIITKGKKPDRVCPTCFKQVSKVIIYGQLSYLCKEHFGPWDESLKKENLNVSHNH